MMKNAASTTGSTATRSAAKISLSLGRVKKTGATAAPVKRPHALLEEDNQDDQDTHDPHVTITHFGQNGASTAGSTVEPAAARTIASLPNRNWRDESRRKRQKSGLPGSAQTNGNVPAGKDMVNGELPTYGLTVSESQPFLPAPTLPAQEDDASSSQTMMAPTPALTADDEAIAALKGHRKPIEVVIAPLPVSDNEEDVFRASHAAAPPMSTLDEYAATPVEGFGAAILRGYLREGETLENRAKTKERIVARRPGLLGIGAKESGLGVELGAWGKGAKGGKGIKGPASDAAYMPLVRKNLKTGEILTQEELEEKLVNQKNNVRSLILDGNTEQHIGRKSLEDSNSIASIDRRKEDYHERSRDRRKDDHHERTRDRRKEQDGDRDSGRDSHRYRPGRDERDGEQQCDKREGRVDGAQSHRRRRSRSRESRRQRYQSDEEEDYERRRRGRRRRDREEEHDNAGSSRRKKHDQSRDSGRRR